MTKQYTVDAPKTPGSAPSTLGPYSTLAAARAEARLYRDRRDLTHQDVVIRDANGRRVEFAGPSR